MPLSPEWAGSRAPSTDDLLGIIGPALPVRRGTPRRARLPRWARCGLSILVLLACGCSDPTGPDEDWNPTGGASDYRTRMSDLVVAVAAHARDIQPGFVVLTRNGLPLLTEDGRPDGALAPGFMEAVSGVARDGVFYDLDDEGSPVDPVSDEELTGYLDRLVAAGRPVLATSYCRTPAETDDAYLRSESRGYLAFAASDPACDAISDYPAAPPGVHAGEVATLAGAHNFLQLLSPGLLSDRGEYLARLAETDHDVLVIDAFHADSLLTAAEVTGLRTKAGGGRRLVVAYLSLGAAETNRDYWQADWETDPPPWLEPADPDRPGSRFVKYWYPGWKEVMMGRSGAYLDRIVAAGFDGVLLGHVDAYEYFDDWCG